MSNQYNNSFPNNYDETYLQEADVNDDILSFPVNNTDISFSEHSNFSSEYSLPNGQHHSENLEHYILGTLLSHNDAVKEFIVDIKPNDFFGSSNRSLFNVIFYIFNEIKYYDTELIKERFVSDSGLSPVDAYSKVDNLFSLGLEINKTLDNFSITKKFNYLLKTLKTYSAKREVKSLAQDILKNKDSNPEEIEDNIQKYFKTFNNIKNSVTLNKSKVSSADDVLDNFLKKSEEMVKKGKSSYVKTGGSIYDSNIKTTFDTYKIIAGRPSMGKTALMINEAYSIACSGIPVFIATLEMSQEALILRILAKIAKIEVEKMKEQKMSENEWERYSEAINTLRKLPITFYECRDEKIGKIISEVEKWYINEVKGIFEGGALFLDYLQLIKSDLNYNGSNADVSRFSEVSIKLKDCSVLFGLYVVALCQLNRDLEKRTNKRPVNSDIRGAGQIEQDADVIEMCYRDEVYNKSTKDKNVMESIFTKQREGSLGILKRRCSEMRFFDIIEIEWVGE